MPFTIAIDGPAGAGKSTVAKRVAAELHLTYIDTGAMYRAVAWKALQTGIDLAEAAALAELAHNLPIRLSPLTPDLRQQVWAGDRDVTAEIRTPEVSRVTSVISAFPAVRRVIAHQQQQMGKSNLRGVVLEGRDIGTVVFPDAPLKIFLTATPEERARRRVKELQAKGMQVEYAQILADQRERDARDSQRADSPLVAADDAVLLNTDALSIDEVVSQILTLARSRNTTSE